MNPQRPQYQDKVWLTLKLVNTAVKYDWLLSLCYFARIRQLYKNGKVYNYSLRKVSRKLDCSPSTLSVHLKKLQANKLITISHGNLQCIGRDNMLKLYPSAMFPIKASTDHQTQLINLKFCLFERNLDKQRKTIQTKKEIIKMHNSAFTPHKKAQRLLKAEKKLNATETSLQINLCLSNRKIGQIYKRSQHTGLRLQKQFNEAGLIISKHNYKVVEREQIGYRAFREKYISNKFHYSNQSGMVFLNLPNRFSYPMH
ncbi:hypothetical protein [Sphingobacterium mizutaii]|uniref:hypothetical protein n=1 Tax=Sphingobacterium mizutaii TaxID=1010 RepID=UPI0028A19A47|nr:hypothetical protein [Sphingobacterium mizutaii]